ncbi:MAG: response regulator [Candidatus Aminicenantaceae bacterium]
MSFRAVIVDDDRVVLNILEKALHDAGFEVETAPDGMKALSIIQTQCPDVVITDLLLPKLHGLELCARIRQNSLLSNVTVILMSAVYDYHSLRQDIDGSEADYFITKPLDVPDLIGFLKRILVDKELEQM